MSWGWFKRKIFAEFVKESDMDGVIAGLIGTGVAAIGTGIGFVGILVGQRMARNTQREQWLLDKRTEDFQAVLTALTSAYMAITRVDTASFTSLYADDMAREVEVIK